MLIKITNRCEMGCNHCQEESTIKGEHMTWETFEKALRFARTFDGPAWSLGAPPFVLLSGGECSEHPEIVRFIDEAIRQRMLPILITNGMWLSDEKLRGEILARGPLLIQVTNDKRFYPQAPITWDDPRITYVHSLTRLIPLGRASRKDLTSSGVQLRYGPTSFNLRSMTRALGSFGAAVTSQRLRAASGLSGHCTPSISHEGYVMAGESRLCFRIGTVESTEKELTETTKTMRCNTCGRVDDLTQEQKRAIGESALYDASEL